MTIIQLTFLLEFRSHDLLYMFKIYKNLSKPDQKKIFSFDNFSKTGFHKYNSKLDAKIGVQFTQHFRLHILLTVYASKQLESFTFEHNQDL